MTTLTLLRQASALANAVRQLEILQPKPGDQRFEQSLAEDGHAPLRAAGIAVLQVNVGKLCNQTCRHCHVDAGPDRREVMTRETMTACMDVLDRGRIPVLDITGGAPEMNPHFRWLAEEARRLDRHVIDRCNLTILLAPGFDDLPEFLAANTVEIIASLPCYLAENTDAQRGDGVFERSVAALRRLNSLGYGHPDSGLLLNLVYNPVGPTLPPSQVELEAAYRHELLARYGVEFNHLYTITNMPISRFLDDLLRTGKFYQYMQKLVDSYNPAAVDGLMCRTTLSVGWDGRLYDCDFNQMLELGIAPQLPQTIHNLDVARLSQRPIVIGQHCYGCTAGAGSSCRGAIATAQ
jgi:radical SAM/Cys-rich protein